jgi:putative transposase
MAAQATIGQKLILQEAHIARTYFGQRKNYSGMSFWARGYFVSTVGADEEVVRVYIQDQEKENHWVEQLSLFK